MPPNTNNPMKKCSKCEEVKELSEFNKDVTNKDGLKCRCRDCTRAQQREYVSRVGDKSLHQKEENIRKLCAYLKEHPCVDCGETDIITLEFDHLPEFAKHRNISRMMHHSWSNIMKEIDKCEVRCANCHRRKTAQRAGWKKLLYMHA